MLAIIAQTTADAKGLRATISVTKVPMIERYEYKHLVWLDVLNPSPEEVRELITEASVPPEFAGDLTAMVPHSETFSKKGALKITLDFPIVRRTDINHPHEVKFLVTKTHLVTIRFEEIEAMHRFGKEFEIRCLLNNGSTSTTPRLFISLLEYLYNSMYPKLDHLEAKLKDIEEEIYNEHEKEMVFELSNVSRKLITFRQTIAAHEHALTQLRDGIGSAFGKKYVPSAETMEHHYHHLNRRIHALISLHQDLRDTNMELLTTKQNEVMKIFTILAFITFPLTLFTSMFGMNTVSTPLIGQQGDFWFILASMGVVSVVFFAFFKYKRWI